MKRILREPLLHFLLLGAGIFLLYGLVGQGRAEREKIVVTQGQIDRLIAGFTRTWQRPPTQPELNGLIQDHIKEEVYCRQAITMGLDRDDTIIRRRLKQKMEFLTDDIAAQSEPTTEQLEAYLNAHPEKFRNESRITFNHVYLNSERHGNDLERDAAQLLEQLKRAAVPADTSQMGDPFLLGYRFDEVTNQDIESQFGREFSLRLAELSQGEWHGPIKSGYGVHLVFINERSEGKIPVLADVRDEVSREWSNDRRQETNEKFYQSLLMNYSVVIEPDQSVQSEKKLAELQ